MMVEIKRILLVEDDPNDVELILSALGRNGLSNEVVVVHDGAAALDFLYRRGPFASRPGGNPVVMLLDLKLPKVDGLEVLKEIKGDSELKTIPVVMLTSSQESRDLESCYRQGVNAYVVKPVKFSDFVAVVKELGMFWAVINEAPPGSNLTFI